MFRFFSKLRHRLIPGSRVGRYLLYAMGEILLVVLGILIALQVDTWNEDRQKKQQAADFRARLYEGVQTDMENIRSRMDFFRKALEYGSILETELAGPVPEGTETQWQFIVQAFHVSQIWNFNQVTAPYNEAQDPEMLGYLGTPELLNALQWYYNEWPLQLAAVTGGTQTYRDFVRSEIPMALQEYMWESCYQIDAFEVQRFRPCKAPKGNAVAIRQAYTAISGNPAFKKMLTRRLSTLYTRNIVYQSILTQAELLLDLLKPD